MLVPILALCVASSAVAGTASGAPPSAAHIVGLDQGVAHTGKASGCIASKTATAADFGRSSQMLRADNYRGKRIRYSAWVKTHEVTGRAALWIRVNGENVLFVADQMINRGVSGTTDWAQLSIVVDVPEKATGIAYGLVANGSGETWIDDMAIEIVDPSVPVSTPAPPPAYNRVIDGVSQAYYRNAPLVPVNMGFEAKK